MLICRAAFRKGAGVSAVTVHSRKRVYGKAVASGAVLASRAARHFGGVQCTGGNLWSTGESLRSKKPMRASGQPSVATLVDGNGLCNGQTPEVALARQAFGPVVTKATRGARVSVNQAAMSG